MFALTHETLLFHMGIDNGSCNRIGNRTAAPTVFDQNSQRDGRIICRSKCNKPSVLSVKFLQRFFVVHLALGNLHDLGGPGLARHTVFDITTNIGPSRAVTAKTLIPPMHDILH